MARHHERLIREAQAAVATAGQPPRRTSPRAPNEIDSFLLGFGLSGAAVRRIRAAWAEDVSLAYSNGYDEAARDASDY